MLLEMDSHHSTLISLNMSPFSLSPSGSSGGGDGGNGGNNMPQQPVYNNYLTLHQQQHPPQQPSPFNQGYVLSNLDASCLFSGPGSGGGPNMDQNAPATASGYSGPQTQSNPGQPAGPQQMIVSGAGGSSVEFPDTKDYIEELCPVCGDKVSGYHYGLLTCESCKGFFKRTVQNKKVYTCVAERSCHIDKTQRKRCPYCRFQKCLDVGMKLEAVRADRMRGGRNKFGPMYKRDRARKLQMMRQRQIAAQTIRGGPSSASGSQMNDPLAGYPPVAAAAAAVVAAAAGGSPNLGHFPNIHIKQEIQIPQVSSLTHSPDSSPSPITVALGQAPSGGGGSVVTPVTSHHQPVVLAGASGLAGVSNAGNGAGGSGSNPVGGVSGDNSSGDHHKLWSANSTTPSPHSLSPKEFHFEAPAAPTTSSNSTKVPRMIREFLHQVDDREWQNSLYTLLQNQTYNQCEVDLFELMCKVLDQNLFSQVDWARNSSFFKDLKVDDQMKLLQHSWSDMLVLDHLHQRMHNALPDEMNLPNGQKFDLLALGLLGVPSLAEHFNALTARLHELKFDLGDYVCLKFLLLLNPDVRGIVNRKHVQEGFEQVQHTLHEYSMTCFSQVQDKFNKLLQVMPEIHLIATRGEDHLYNKHCNGSAPSQTLLMEMLTAKRK